MAGAWRIDGVFAAVAATWPDRPAVTSGGTTLTYAMLDRQSRQVASRLLDGGLARGDICAVDCGSLVDFAVGALGVLRAGGAYLAIETRPARAKARQTVPEGVARFRLGRSGGGPAGEPGDLVAVRQAAPVGALPPRDNLATAQEGRGDVAYVCYTSGTTGAPKGVLAPHGGVRGLVSDPLFRVLRPGSRIASTSTFAFDAATFEVWGALLNGACVIEAPAGSLHAPRGWSDFVRSERIDGAFLTTSIFHALASLQPDAFGGLECLVIGGEACQPHLAARVLTSAAPPKHLINGYGPTETTTFATAHRLRLEEVEALRAPIGRPLAGRTAYIVTAAGDLAAVGETGELLVGGDGVSPGYLGDPEMTAEKFVPDRFGGDIGARLYRTGDLCRQGQDGAIEFLGRADHQVKVRGFRIELQGVAALLRLLPGVRDAVVLPSPGRFGDLELIAFLVGDRRHGERELRHLASQGMAAFMLPAAFHWVDAFPLTDAGKLDQTTLLRLSADARTAGAASTEADDPVIEHLRQIWVENGVRADVAPDDDYADAGGNSLALVAVALDVERRFGVTLSPEVLGGPMTLRSLAAHITRPDPAAQTDAPASIPRAFVISQPWNMLQFPGEIAAAASTFGAWKQLQIPPATDAETLYPTVSAMAAELVRQVRATGAPGPHVLIGHSFGGVLAFEVARQLESVGEPVERLVLLDSYQEVPRGLAGRVGVWALQAIWAIRDRDGRFFADRVRRLVGRGRATDTGPDALANHLKAHCIRAMADYAPSEIAAAATIVRCRRYASRRDRPALSTRRMVDDWSRLIRGPRDEVYLDTDHAGLVRDPAAIRAVAERLARTSVSGHPSRDAAGTGGEA